MNHLAALPGVTCKWLTSWEEQAPLLLAPAIGLDAAGWEVICGVEDDDPANWRWWKLDRIRKDLEQDRPEGFIWLDDDITSDPAARNWVGTAALPHLALCPTTAHGLTVEHLRLMRQFLKLT